MRVTGGIAALVEAVAAGLVRPVWSGWNTRSVASR